MVPPFFKGQFLDSFEKKIFYLYFDFEIIRPTRLS